MHHTDTDITFWLIRHAESVMNRLPHLLGGQTPNAPLTNLGLKQVCVLAERFKREHVRFDAVYASPFTRTMSTASAPAMHCAKPVITARELVEFSQGEWEGRARTEIYTDDIRLRMAERAAEFIPPGGDSQRAVARRASGFLYDAIIENPDYRSGPRHIAVVSHGLTIKCLMQDILGFDRQLIWRWAVDNTSISKFRYDRRGWWPICVNDTAHLSAIE